MYVSQYGERNVCTGDGVGERVMVVSQVVSASCRYGVEFVVGQFVSESFA